MLLRIGQNHTAYQPAKWFRHKRGRRWLDAAHAILKRLLRWSDPDRFRSIWPVRCPGSRDTPGQTGCTKQAAQCKWCRRNSWFQQRVESWRTQKDLTPNERNDAAWAQSTDNCWFENPNYCFLCNQLITHTLRVLVRLKSRVELEIRKTQINETITSNSMIWFWQWNCCDVYKL